MTDIITPVAWRRSQSLYQFTKPTSVHLLPTGAERALCGVLVPKEARPGYHQPVARLWFEIKVAAVDVNNVEEWELDASEWDPEVDDIPHCKRCQAKLKGAS